MAGAALIGPNALLQLTAPMAAHLGASAVAEVFAAAGTSVPPPDSGMIAQARVTAVFTTLAHRHPADAGPILQAAGAATADYILANRIPVVAASLIRALPGALGARLLAAAIGRHAWTFAGSGQFRHRLGVPLILEIAQNPLALPSLGRCDWHAAVFQRLFASLAWPDAQVHEGTCCGRGDPACRFVIAPRGKHLAGGATTEHLNGKTL